MPFKDPNASVLFPILQIENDLIQSIKKHHHCPPGDLQTMMTFLFEVREEFMQSKLNPDIAFIFVFGKWSRKYASKPLMLEDIQIHSKAIVEYLVSQSRSLESQEKSEWITALCDFTKNKVIEAVKHNETLCLTK